MLRRVLLSIEQRDEAEDLMKQTRCRVEVQHCRVKLFVSERRRVGAVNEIEECEWTVLRGRGTLAAA